MVEFLADQQAGFGETFRPVEDSPNPNVDESELYRERSLLGRRRHLAVKLDRRGSEPSPVPR